MTRLRAAHGAVGRARACLALSWLAGAAALPVTPAATAAGLQPPTERPAEAQAADAPGWWATSWADVTDTQAWRGAGHWRWAFAPLAPHFNYSPDHRRVWALAVERQRPDGWLAGLSYFRNSFGQPSAYVYLGRRVEGVFDVPQLFFQGSAGVLYGYVGEFKDKVALNVGGFAPGALVGLGWHWDERRSALVHLLGDAGLMLQLSYDFR